MAKDPSDVSDCPEMDCFMNESMSDVVFIIDGQKLPALKSYLSVKSRVFRVMFSDSFKESKDREVVIKDTTFEAFKALIQFLYCDKLVLEDEKDLELIQEVCKLSDRYEVTKVLDKISDHLKRIGLTFENLDLISRIAFDYKIKDLMSYVLTFIDYNFDEFVKKDMKQVIAFNELTESRLMEVMVKNYRRMKSQLKVFYRPPGFWSKCDAGSVPNCAQSPVIGGTDIDGEPLYVGRALHQRYCIPGKVKPTHGVCYVPFYGTEYAHEDYQVLTNQSGCELIWVSASGGQIPPGAIQGGEEEGDRKLYIGRAHYNGSLIVGKVVVGQRLYVPFDGNEVPIDDYEVLVCRDSIH